MKSKTVFLKTNRHHTSAGLQHLYTLTGIEFKNIFEENFDSLRAYIYYKSADEELATDIAQECFLKLWEKKDAVASTNINGLLYKMAHDLFINSYHRQKRTEIVFKNISYNKTVEYSPEELLLFEQLQEKYEHLVSAMPEKQRTVFLMSRIDGLMNKEIAERLGLSVKAVEKRMKNALQYLKSALIIS